jgi:hypothetical protein
VIAQVWRTMLGADDPASPIVAPDEADEVVNLLLTSKIDPQKFGGNAEAIMSATTIGFEARHGLRRPLPTTPSITKIKTDSYGFRMIPPWMVAGFPDVIHWFGEAQANGEDGATQRGVPSDSDDSAEAHAIENTKGFIRARYWHNLVVAYMSRTGRALEAAVDEGTDSDVYAASALLGMMGEESNFTLIASRATKYYLELSRSHRSAFPSETSLLAMAGMLTGLMYILGLQKVSCGEVVAIACETEGQEDRLLEFVIRLEVLLLAVDSPEISADEVAETCEDQRDSIHESIRRTTDTYASEPPVANDVRTVMSGRNFAMFRKAANVKPSTVLGKLRGMFGG